MSGPLAGFKILDLTTVVMGPYATQILADYGADVIKIEPPEGDLMRKSGPMRNPDMGHLYLNINRNKRSVVLDLKQSAGREVLLRMAADSDVLVYNIRPQAMARLGLSYEAVRERAPQLVYAGAYGFSQSGPYAAKPAYDDLVQGMCCVPSLSVQAGSDKPRYAPIIIVDRMVALQLATAISTALVHRERTGVGQRVDVPMFEGMLSVVLGEHLAGKLFTPPEGPPGYRRTLALDRRPYETRDGYICVLLYNDKHWQSFFDAIGRPEVYAQDQRFQGQNNRLVHIEYVYSYLSAAMKERTTGEWQALLDEADIPAAPMYDIDAVLGDAHVAATGFVRTVTHPTEGDIFDLRVPTEWSSTPPEFRHHAPTLGQHTHEVLGEHGYSAEEIEAMARAGTIRV